MRKRFLVLVALGICLMVAVGAAAVTSPSISAADRLAPKSLNSIAWKVVRECTNSSMSQYEKAIALYDWLIDHTVYRGGATNPYHVLRYGEASCSGYANAYKILLSKVGIKAKTIDGRLYTLDHSWSLIFLGGKWYHVDVRMGDHLADTEGRYRRFCLSDEQARLYYSFGKKTKANAYLYNYAYKTGQLNNAITYIRNAVNTRAAAGDKLFIINMTAGGAPSELNDPFSRITVKNALQNLACACPGIPDKGKAVLTLTDNLLLARIEVPTYRVKQLTLTMPVKITVEVAGSNFSAIPPLELGDKIVIAPTYATQKKLYWNSTREKTATVSQSGTVKIVGFGVTRIKAATMDGSKLSRYYDVIVIQKQV